MIKKIDYNQIEPCLQKLKNLKVLVIGDTIIDHYVFVAPKGRAIKDPILSVEYKSREVYAGGILAIANHIADFVEKINLVTLIGDQNPLLNFINQSLKKNIELKTFVKENSPTSVKKRMVDYYRKSKIFKIEYINDYPINDKLSKEIIFYLDEEIPKYDLVVVGDFGHGFINDDIRRKIEEKSRFLALNVQSNSANMGYNYFNLYKQFDFISLNEDELRLPLTKRFEEIEEVITEACNKYNLKSVLLTQGNRGCMFIREGNVFKAPAVITSVKDTVGAGDAVFAISSLFVYANFDDKLLPFLANCAGGIAANIMGNKESVTREKLLNSIQWGIF